MNQKVWYKASIMEVYIQNASESTGYNSSRPPALFLTWNASIVTSTSFFLPFLCDTFPRTASSFAVGEKDSRSAKMPGASLAVVRDIE